MPRSIKLEIQEDLGNAVGDTNAGILTISYRKLINRIQGKAIADVSKGIRPTQKRIRTTVRITGVNRAVRNSYILANVNLLLQNSSNKRLQRGLKPIKSLMALYSVKNPKQFASKIDKIVKRSLGVKIPLNPREEKAFRIVNQFLNKNKEQIQDLIRVQNRELKRINKEITTSQSRAIIKRRNKLIRERIVVKGVKRPLTNDEIATRLNAEFRNDRARVERIVRTESHSLNELTKTVVARDQGFTHKIWNTQRDSKVRDTHREIDRVKKPIDSLFKVGKEKGQFPGDKRLKGEGINCRCFLTHE